MNVKCDIIDYWLVEMWLLVVQPWTGTRLNISHWRPKHRHSLKQSSIERLCNGIKKQRRSPWLLLHLYHLFHCSWSWEKNGLVKCVMMLGCVLLIEKDVGNHSFICAFFCLCFFPIFSISSWVKYTLFSLENCQEWTQFMVMGRSEPEHWWTEGGWNRWRVFAWLLLSSWMLHTT